MKQYSLATLLFLSFVSPTMAQMTDVEEYYKQALHSKITHDALQSNTAESIYESAKETEKKIEAIRAKLEQLKTTENLKPEERQALQQELQTQLSLLQTNLQISSVQLQSLAMMSAKTSKTREEVHEEETQEKRQQLQEALKEKEEQLKAMVERANGRL
ncbi:type IV secretion system protein VirB5 [Bartonella raoultii]|uniref:Type IV secretion system protein VirB5 n=1 Tax=Bartonella raoultii TaxID=1457020 RepID=A0ABS7I3H0_9HYPH|nr:type IV secretion system protein VirB5 [Bartonella raoultii]MBX4335223.1 type IV secretion system protein VirB5 [Bartonella raoultii]